jgi:hypothetical protein
VDGALISRFSASRQRPNSLSLTTPSMTKLVVRFDGFCSLSKAAAAVLLLRLQIRTYPSNAR